jgi:hypothetical protein
VAAPQPGPAATAQRAYQAPPQAARVAPVSKSGSCYFSDLPPAIKERLLARVSGRNKVQYAVKLGGLGLNYILALVFTGWFAYLFSTGSDPLRWRDEERQWLMAISLAVGALQGLNIHHIVRWHRSRLKSWLLITPLYIMKTRFDRVWFWPLWELDDMRATHHHRNGSYQHTSVRMVFAKSTEEFTVTPELTYSLMVGVIRTFQDKIRVAIQQGDRSYFAHEDDFSELGANPPVKQPATKPVLAAGILAASFALYALAFSIADAANKERPFHIEHEVLPLASSGYPSSSRPRSSSSPSSSFSYPDSSSADPMPLPSYERDYAAEARGYDFRRGANGFPEKSLAPSQAKAEPKPAKPPFTEPEKPLPADGEVRIFNAKQERIAPFEIKSSYDSNHLVKLVDAVSGKSVMTIFVRGGSTVKVDVPLGNYRVKYASGDKWYGDVFLFGPDTRYSKADDAFLFHRQGNDVSGYTITLYQVAYGNLHTEEIGAEEF